MDANDREQTELLRNIWNEMKALGQNLGGRIDKTNERLDTTNERLDTMRVELKGEITETNVRLDQANARLDQSNVRLGAVEETLRDLAAQQLMLGRYVKHSVERQSDAVDDLRQRVTRIETRLGREG